MKLKITFFAILLTFVGGMAKAEISVRIKPAAVPEGKTHTFSTEIIDSEANAGNPGYSKEIIHQCYQLDNKLYPILYKINRKTLSLKDANEKFNYQGNMNLFMSLPCSKVLKSSKVAHEQHIQKLVNEMTEEINSRNSNRGEYLDYRLKDAILDTTK